MWIQHGGSGLAISWETAWNLDWDELLALIAMINRRRSAEAAALRSAGRRSR